MDGRTVRGKINQSGGGVARNIADALGKLRINPCLISAVGDEQLGNFLLKRTIPHLGTEGIIKTKDTGTGTCMVLCDHTGECLVVVGDMGIHQKITADHVRSHERTIVGSSLVVLDGNLPQETMDFVLRLCHENSVPDASRCSETGVRNMCKDRGHHRPTSGTQILSTTRKTLGTYVDYWYVIAAT